MRPPRHRAAGAARALAGLAVAAGLLLAGGWVPGGRSRGLAAAAAAEVDWKAEFAEVCSRTQDAMSLGDAELQSLVARCDRLRPAIEKLEEPLRKVQLRRLQVCRELYQFVLDARAPGAAK